MARHNELGTWGEDIACEKLITDGHAICERNWRVGHYEIDIITMRGNRIIFVEVKTRTDNYVDPLESIDKKKILHMIRSANAYINRYNIPHEPQFDIILITGTPQSGYQIEHIEDAFIAPLTTIR